MLTDGRTDRQAWRN